MTSPIEDRRRPYSVRPDRHSKAAYEARRPDGSITPLASRSAKETSRNLGRLQSTLKSNGSRRAMTERRVSSAGDNDVQIPDASFDSASGAVVWTAGDEMPTLGEVFAGSIDLDKPDIEDDGFGMMMRVLRAPIEVVSLDARGPQRRRIGNGFGDYASTRLDQ